MEVTMPDQMNSPPSHKPHSKWRAISFGPFLIVAGAILLAERMGWLPLNADWLLPIILIAWGASEVYAHVIS
jgi:hypothetical protein